ncbi:5'/3'-nucleotidase SurE [Haploplasma axanthum]|uniref:5'-nucleotidase SurE n=1 Tax=Haploplasma axanthum TaxID=29552 RepID=A0A449BED9_HAPAX|nr:5'/3'-nucleotidase SurE [Haploplasma axanthum]VEU80824.1 5'-nucleotidase surE [Haploplasma axanthum]
MNILIVNDDGIESKGLEVLARALAPHGKIYVSAPMNQQSGKSHAITIYNTLEVVQMPLLAGTIGTIAVNGSPADATKAGLRLFNVDFDLVVSGINDGPNIAKDILYSGTVGAAFEAKIYGVNAIAISADGLELEYLYDETIKTLDEIIENKLYEFDGILNVNFPKYTFAKPLGVLFTNQGKRYFHSELIKKNSIEDHYYLKGSISQFEEDLDSDVWAYNNGYISITPLTLNRTHHEMLNKLKKTK